VKEIEIADTTALFDVKIVNNELSDAYMDLRGKLLAWYPHLTPMSDISVLFPAASAPLAAVLSPMSDPAPTVAQALEPVVQKAALDIISTAVAQPESNASLSNEPAVSAVADGKIVTPDHVQLISDIQVIFVLGGPGSGKGTQCKRIAEEFDFTHLSTGDLLRAEVERGSEIGKSVADIMSHGGLAPLDTVLQLVRVAILESGKRHFLLDGYPREISQVFAFEKQVAPCTFVLYFEAAEEELVSRCCEPWSNEWSS
jgi:hypothetical protein